MDGAHLYVYINEGMKNDAKITSGSRYVASYLLVFSVVRSFKSLTTPVYYLFWLSLVCCKLQICGLLGILLISSSLNISCSNHMLGAG